MENNFIAKDKEAVQDGEEHMGDIGIDNGEAEYEPRGMDMVVIMIVMMVVMLVIMVMVMMIMMLVMVR